MSLALEAQLSLESSETIWEISMHWNGASELTSLLFSIYSSWFIRICCRSNWCFSFTSGLPCFDWVFGAKIVNKVELYNHFIRPTSPSILTLGPGPPVPSQRTHIQSLLIQVEESSLSLSRSHNFLDVFTLLPSRTSEESFCGSPQFNEFSKILLAKTPTHSL